MSIFKDHGKLSLAYIPGETPHREGELNKIIEYFNPVVAGETGYTHLFLIGRTGTGKTMVSRHLEKHLSGKGLKVIYVNARLERIPGNIVRRIYREVFPTGAVKGYSIEELYIRVLDELVKGGLRLVLVLDDSDHLFIKHKNFIYMIGRSGELSGGVNPVSAVFILHDNYMFKELNGGVLSSLKKNIIYFSDYGYEELRDILMYRAEEAFKLGCIEDEAVSAAADISELYGYNAGYGVELLRKAGLIADKTGCGSVSVEHIRFARSDMPPGVSHTLLTDLPKSSIEILYATASALVKKAFTPLDEVRELYKEEREYVEEDFENGLEMLKAFGLISRRIFSGKEYIGLPSIPASTLQTELENILRREEDI